METELDFKVIRGEEEIILTITEDSYGRVIAYNDNDEGNKVELEGDEYDKAESLIRQKNEDEYWQNLFDIRRGK